MVSMKEIARTCGVSVATVSKALSDKKDISKPTRDRIRKVAEEMGYKMTGTTTFMSREPLLEVDIIIVFERYQRDLLTRVLDYDHWDRIRLFNQLAFDTNTDVDDPSSEREHIYRTIALHIEEGCRRILNRITKDESNF